MLNVTIDTDLDYQDDVVYIPYVKKDVTTWTQGGVGRLLTNESTSPSDWDWSPVMDNIGPVTSAVVNLQNKKRGELWLYFGTGRYYFELANNTDDATGQRQIFGIKEPCFNTAGLDSTCTTSRTIGELTDVTVIANVPSDPTVAGYNGWYINLDAAGSFTYSEAGTNVTRDYKAERTITDPVTTTTGLVFFTTYKPYGDICAYGGKSFIWAVKYDTGGAPGALLKGVALVQVSTGAIEQVDLSTAFADAGGRKTSALEGVPPTAQGLSLVSTPPPIKRVIHMRER
jgi:type IV pilus assembly protein PilY1